MNRDQSLKCDEDTVCETPTSMIEVDVDRRTTEANTNHESSTSLETTCSSWYVCVGLNGYEEIF